jgi:hypothetical protein
MAATWPDTLPLPEGSNYKIQAGSSVIRTNFDDGYISQRQRYSSALDSLQASCYFTDAQLVTFEDFVQYTLNGGAGWFTMTLRDGDGMRDMECRINNGEYEVAKAGLKWHVAFKLDIDNR